jgi:hypothetical protein
MTKTPNHIFFFSSTKIKIFFFSNIGNQNIFLEKNHVICISESHLDKSIDNDKIKLKSFQNPVRLDRNRHGGDSITAISRAYFITLQVWTQKCAVQKASVDVNISYY